MKASHIVYVVLLPLTVLASSAGIADQQMQPKPNVIWILMDALRAESLSCYGYERPTSPTIDRLAQRGVLMEEHYAQALWTRPSVPSYMSGRYFPVDCFETFRWCEIELIPPKGERLIPEIMRENGYRTVMFTAHHSYVSVTSRLGKAFGEGYPIRPDKGMRSASFGKVNDAFFEWLEQRRAKPFFAYIHLMDTHFPHELVGRYSQWLAENPSEGVFERGKPRERWASFSEIDVRHMFGLYDGSILYADEQLDRLTSKLAEEGILENTVIIISSDHGDCLGEDSRTWGHWSFTHDQILHVPLVMAGPGIPEGVRIRSFSENVDIVPTLIELLGLDDMGAEIDGKSLVTLMRDPDASPVREYVFAKWVGVPFGYIIRSRAFKYEYYPGENREHLWKVPDNNGARVDLREREAAALRKMRAIALKRFKPLYDAYSDLPIASIHLRITDASSLEKEPADAVIMNLKEKLPVSTHTDNKWVIHNGGLIGRERLISCGWQEDAPPLTFHFGIPNGKYAVYAEIPLRPNYYGHPVAAFRIKAEGDTRFRVVRPDPGMLEEARPSLLYAGIWTVEDGVLDLTVDEADHNHWVIISGFRLTPVSGNGTADEEALRAQAESLKQKPEAVRAETLRALGYLE